MSGPRFATNVAITVLTTLVVASIAFAASAGLHLYRTAEVPQPTPSPAREGPAVQLPFPPSTVQPAAGLYVIDQDLIGAAAGWMLVSDCPLRANPTCHNAVVQTQDAGLTWTEPVQVGPQFASTDGGAPRNIRFLNPNDGFVYGASGAFVTHDGGKTWAAVAIPAVFVDSLAAWGDVVWIATHPCAKGSPCLDELRSSLDGGRSWSTPRKLPPGFIPENAVAFASGATFWSAVAPYGIETTTDLGRTWRNLKSSCGQPAFNDYVATSNGLELWTVCWPLPDANGTIATGSVTVSEDGGQTWAQRTLPASLALPGWLVSPRPRVAFEPGDQVTYVTHDGGGTWTRLMDGAVSFVVMRFTSAGWGWALDQERNVWLSADGGDHWSQLGALPDRLG